MNTNKDLAKELFEMVYGWGRLGVVADENCPAFKKTIEELLSQQKSDLIEEIEKEIEKINKLEVEEHGNITSGTWFQKKKWISLTMDGKTARFRRHARTGILVESMLNQPIGTAVPVDMLANALITGKPVEKIKKIKPN